MSAMMDTVAPTTAWPRQEVPLALARRAIRNGPQSNPLT